jgi:hypothetical protein
MFIFVFSQFDGRKVHFGLGTISLLKPIHCILLSLVTIEWILKLLGGSVLSLKIFFTSTPRFVAKNNSLDHSQDIVKSCRLLQPSDPGNQKISLECTNKK